MTGVNWSFLLRSCKDSILYENHQPYLQPVAENWEFSSEAVTPNIYDEWGHYAGNTSSCNERIMRGSGNRMGSICKGSFHGLAPFLDRHWYGYSLSPRSQSTHKSSVMKSNVPTNIMVDRAKNDMTRLKLLHPSNLTYCRL
ncbi:hypothetical protein WG66_006500 [Moniliophthora roreri]|nr:hypothetical protein WG66_006500 [Moniliophthora roreri]